MGDHEIGQSTKPFETFLYSVSHDLQRPFRHVRSFADLLQRRYADRLDDKGINLLEHLVKAGADGESMLNDLRELSRVYSRPTHFERVALGAVMDRALKPYASKLQACDADVVVSKELPLVTADAAQLEEAFAAVIANALKFRDPGRKLRITVSAERDDEGVAIQIADNGVGFSERHCERIMLPFQQLDSATPGTGMGLALCRAVAEVHGGRLTVDSEVDVGTTVHLVLADPARNGTPT